MLNPFELEFDGGQPVVEIAVDCGPFGTIRVWTEALRARDLPANKVGATALAYQLLSNDSE